MKTKVEVVKNFYITADKSSSSPELTEESKRIIDNLLRCNGYTDPRSFKDTHIRTPKTITVSQDEKTCLKIPNNITEYVSYQILNYIRKRRLLISVIFLPGRKLRGIFCNSRPLDRTSCTSMTCNICERLEDNVDCRTSCTSMTCNICERLEDNVDCRTSCTSITCNIRERLEDNVDCRTSCTSITCNICERLEDNVDCRTSPVISVSV